MGQIIIRNVDDLVIERLRERARGKGVSFQQELREIVTAASCSDRAGFRRRASELRRHVARKTHTDSTVLVRADRDR